MIDVEPYAYPTEKRFFGLHPVVRQYGSEPASNALRISSPDTLSLFYETQEYTLTFLEESKDSVFVGALMDSLSLFQTHCFI